MTEFELKQKMEKLGDLIKIKQFRQMKFDNENKELDDRIDDLKTELKTEILQRKQSIVSEHLIAQYRKGPVKWETKWLDGFAIDHPEYHLGQYRKIGDPTVAFSFPKEKK